MLRSLLSCTAPQALDDLGTLGPESCALVRRIPPGVATRRIALPHPFPVWSLCKACAKPAAGARTSQRHPPFWRADSGQEGYEVCFFFARRATSGERWLDKYVSFTAPLAVVNHWRRSRFGTAVALPCVGETVDSVRIVGTGCGLLLVVRKRG